MTKATYEEVADVLDALAHKHDPLVSEANRQAFAAAWTAYLDTVGWTWDEFIDVASDRIGWGAPS